MKAGLTTSVILHATLIGFGLFTLSAPRSLEVADVEAFPVDIVPVESITQIQQGDKRAVKKEKSAPIPTKKPDIVADAKKVGEADVDTDKKPTPEPKPKPVEAKAAPAPSPDPAPKPDTDLAKEPAKQPEQKPAAAPATEVAAVPQPKQEVKPDPVAEAIVAETPDAEKADLPETAPTPQSRPKQPQAETAKAPERKETEKPTVKEASKPKSEEKEFNADEVAALLSKEQASGGGAKRSTDEAALGGTKSTKGATKLTQGEIDALRGQIQRCWNVPAGALDAENLKVAIRFNLTPAGEVEGSPEIVEGGGADGVQRAAAEAARRAILQCGPYTLPADKYDGDDGWNQVLVNFDPTDMF
jgi:outer membrane biosynthesis protein TonB